MPEPEIDYPYWQQELPVPYVPYSEYAETVRYQEQQQYQQYQQQTFVPPFQLPRADGVYHAVYRQPVTPARPSFEKAPTPRMSKADALAFVSECKRWLVAGSIVAFGLLSGLVAGHVVGANANQLNNQAAPSSNPFQQSPSDNGGYFQQQPGGDNFGNGNAGQPPVSGSHTS